MAHDACSTHTLGFWQFCHSDHSGHKRWLLPMTWTLRGSLPRVLSRVWAEGFATGTHAGQGPRWCLSLTWWHPGAPVVPGCGSTEHGSASRASGGSESAGRCTWGPSGSKQQCSGPAFPWPMARGVAGWWAWRECGSLRQGPPEMETPSVREHRLRV